MAQNLLSLLDRDITEEYYRKKSLIFPVELPRGSIVYKGQIFLPYSLVEQKAGIARKKIILNDLGDELALAQSSTSKQLQDFNLHHSVHEIRDFVKSAYTTNDNKNDEMEYSHVVGLLTEMEKTIKVFWEIANDKTMSQGNIARVKKAVFKNLDSLVKEEEKPCLKIMHPFLNVEKTLPMDDFLDEERYGNDRQTHYKWSQICTEIKSGEQFLNLRNRAEKYLNKILKGESSQYPTIDSDLYTEFIKTFLPGIDGLLYVSSDKRPIKIMARYKTDKDYQRTIKINGNKYRKVEEFTQDEFNVAMYVFFQSALLNSLPKQKKVLEGYKISLDTFFPIETKNVKIGFVKDNENDKEKKMNVTIGFSAYAMVDIQNPDYAFIMEPGKLTFRYKLNNEGEPIKFIDYSVLDNKNVQNYYHFFVNLDHICGFHPISPSTSSDVRFTLSRLIWENYVEAFSVLTDGLKYDSGFKRIANVREQFQKEKITFEGNIFNRYVKRSEIEQMNSGLKPNKRMHIGSGLAK